ncbi:MAG: acyl-ACP thioesterase domain-containing protein [Candidatus Limnocylindrales bacterium]
MTARPTEDAQSDERLDVLADRLPYRIVRQYRIRFEEATADETIRTAIFLAWAADIAWQHSALLGFDRDWYTSRGFFWLVRAVRLDVLKPVRTYGSAFVTTQVMGYRRIGAHRHSEVRDASGELMAGLEIDWVMTNARGVPTRVPDDMVHFVPDPLSTFEMLKVTLAPTPPDAAEQAIRVRRRDLDPLDHVNNSVYIDYFEEALEAAGQGALLTALPRRYEIDFVAAAERDDLLVGRTWPIEDGWAYRLSRDDGTEIFRARVALI